MADLDIYIEKEDGKTYTHFRKYWYHGQVSFHNLEAKPQNPADLPEATLKITVGANILCRQGQTVTEIVVPPEGEEKAKICKDYGGGPFKYTAQIGTSTPEDPIIIIEKALLSAALAGVVVVAVAGAAVGAIIANYFAARRLARLRAGS